jgi:hypothetical protein
MGLMVSGFVKCALSSCVSLRTLLSYSSKQQDLETEAIASVFMVVCKARLALSVFMTRHGLNNRGVIAGNIRGVSHCCYIYSGCVVHPISFNPLMLNVSPLKIKIPSNNMCEKPTNNQLLIQFINYVW